MKQLALQIWNFTKKHTDFKLYFSILLFLSICLYFNFKYDFEDSYIDSYTGRYIKGLWMFLFQGIPYLVVCFILYAFGKKTKWLTSKGFWLRFLIGFTLLSLERSLSFGDFVSHYFSGLDRHFYHQILLNTKNIITIILPLSLLYLFIEKEKPPNYYGLRLQSFDARPYFILLAFAFLLVLGGSFISDLQAHYPMYRQCYGDQFADYYQFPRIVSVLIYELTYGFNFISIELFFRGFLIIAFYKYFGPYVILPMMATYCFLHFGKPLTEAISSIFGAYILGILAIHHKNIWGGVILHIGLAWMMEFIGYLHRL